MKAEEKKNHEDAIYRKGYEAGMKQGKKYALLSQPQGENTESVEEIMMKHCLPDGGLLPLNMGQNIIAAMKECANSVGVTPMTEDEMRDWFDNLVLPDYELIGSFMALQSHLLTQNQKTKED